MRVIAVVLFLALAACAAALWLAPSSAPTVPSVRPDEDGLAGANCGTTEPELRFVQGVSDRSAAETPAPAPEPAPPGIEDAGAAPVGVDFAWKYARKPRAELVERLTMLDSTLQRDMDLALAVRWKTEGGFAHHEVAPGDARPVDEIVESLKNEGELCGSRLVIDAASGGGTRELRPRAVDIACLSRKDHVDLYALAAERDWLREYVRGLPQSDE